MDAIKRWWDGIGQAFEAFERTLRPWEQEGPLRWVKPVLGEWELHGSTIPEQHGLGRPRGPLTTFRW